MAVVISATVMRGPGTSANTPYPASYIGLIGTDMITSVTPYVGPQSGVNSILRIRFAGSRSLVYKGTYYVNETVTVLQSRINA